MIAKLAFGNTGHQSSRAILGAAAFGTVTQREVDDTLALALELGVNHVDTAASYGDSELRLGDWIRRHGRPSFLASKTGERTREAAREGLERSLERLGVDCIDLMQLHNLVEPSEWQTALGPGGALEALVEAREQGLVRFIGVTGHGLWAPRQHRKALARFAFDSVLFPLNFQLFGNEEYRSDAQALMQHCRTHGVAMQTIKSIVRAPWGDREPRRATWYEPMEARSEIELAAHWVLSQGPVFLNTVGDVNVVPTVLRAVESFKGAPAEALLAEQSRRLQVEALFTEPFLR